MIDRTNRYTPGRATPRRVSGFGLIELMVVLAIVGLLATIAIPSFTRYKCKARAAEAVATLRGVYSANIAYYGDYGTFTNDFTRLRTNLAVTSALSARGTYFTYTFANAPTTAAFTCVAQNINPPVMQFQVRFVAPRDSANGRVDKILGGCL